jgi:hypothetical protein
LSGSEFVSVQFCGVGSLGQIGRNEAQSGAQELSKHVSAIPQPMSQAPQLFGSLEVSVQPALQACQGGAQPWHIPSMHVSIGSQVWKHSPQFDGSHQMFTPSSAMPLPSSSIQLQTSMPPNGRQAP